MNTINTGNDDTLGFCYCNKKFPWSTFSPCILFLNTFFNTVYPPSKLVKSLSKLCHPPAPNSREVSQANILLLDTAVLSFTRENDYQLKWSA